MLNPDWALAWVDAAKIMTVPRMVKDNLVEFMAFPPAFGKVLEPWAWLPIGNDNGNINTYKTNVNFIFKN